MKKRLLSILLLLTMLFTLLPAEAMAVVADNINTAVSTAQERKSLENPFADVREGSWYYDAVQYARINGFFSGTSATAFAPDGTMSRGMFVTVLGRMAGVDQSAYKEQPAFSDVAADAYYAPFVAWAAKHGITIGVGEDTFDPNGLINREQMAVFFVRYFETFGVDYDTGTNITTVPADLETVSPWAQDAVLKLWKTGLLSGDGVHFNPKGNASRAQAATLCMRTDQAVGTWYREPGVPSDRVSIDPGTEQTPEPSKPSTGGSSGGSGGESNTTYYNVTFVVDAAEDKRLYQKDTLLSTLPTPAQSTGKVFLGWYHDAEKSKPVSGDDRLTANTTLYAKFTDTAALSEGGAPNFASALDQAPSFSIAVQSDTQPILGTDFKFRNITAPDKTPEGTVTAEDAANVETVKVESSGGVWTISSKNGGFTPGHTYQIELISDDMTYQDSTAEVRFFNFSIAQDGTLNLKLNDDIKYIDVNQLNAADGANLMEYAGLYLASTDGQGLTTYAANDGSGSFTYTGNDIKLGDTVSVYAGTKPSEREPEKGTDDKTDNGDVSYVKITAIDGSTYHYVAAEAEDVLFTPDVLPIDVDNGDGTSDWTQGGSSVTVETIILDFSDPKYEKMGLSADTTVDVGDYLAFFTGVFGQEGAQDQAYGEIKTITVNGNITTLTYTVATAEQVMSAMDVYDETQLIEEELQAAIDENQGEIQRIIEAQLMESDFFDDAGEYLAGLALQTDEVKEILGDGLTMSDCIITYADGTPLGADDLALMGNIIDKDQDGKKPKASVSISPNLSHFDGKGLRVEVAVSYTFQIQKSGSDTIMEVNLTAFFEQEIIIGFSVSGGAVWKWKWIFPYISDFRMNGNLDLGTYTGIGITATAKLTQDEEPWGMLWPDDDYEKAIVNIGESIKKKMEEVETVLPEAEATASGGLAEKYAEFMAGANEDWVDLITVKILDISGAVDPFHILAYGLQVDFVVSANLNVALGMTFQYENFKRHSFTLSLKSKKADSDTVDLSTNGYQFDFYVMGTIGLRAGIRAKATVGLFSTKLAGIGLQIEAGAYTRMWGYFYYHLDNWKIDGKWEKNSGSSGAALIEIGAYLDVKFIAEALNGKYQYAPTIYAKEWPFWSAGRRENVYDFAYADNPTYAILNVTTYTLPSAAYDMLWMDLKTGETGTDDDKNTKNFDGDTAVNGDDEAHFAVELSNPNFTYNPVDNTVSVGTASGALEQSCEMVITWKGAPLSGSTETLSRTVTLNWSNDANAGTIAFESNGGSAAQMLRMLAGTSLSGGMPASPTKLGYTFAGWYTDAQLSTSFTATAMPEGNTTLYAKWTPKIVSHTEEHYQKALSGRYVLTDTTSKTGETDSQTTSVAKTYTGFTAQPIEQQTIAPDGSTRVSIYYDRVSYPLTFTYGTGGSDVTVSTPYGATIVKPSNPSKQGYLFSGWSAAIPGTMPANPLTFTAQWAEKTDTPYTVKHYKQNLDGTYALEQTEGKFGTTGETTAAEARTYTGFTAQTITQKSIAPDGRTVVEIQYARNSHSLTWNVNGGNDLAGNYTNGSTKYGTAIVKPDNPTRAGYIFGGWYQDSELTTALENNASMPDVPLTLYAKWTAKGDTPYTVKHVRQALDDSYPENNGLVETAAMTGTTGQNTAAVAKSYTGFNVQDFEQTTIAADGSTVVEIRYKRNSYALTWDVNGGSTLTGDYTSGDTKYGTAILIPTPTRAGYNFMGWYKDAELTTALVEATMPDHALTLTAKWDLIPEGGYAVKHIRQDLDGSYPESGGLVETETLTGLKGQSTEAKAKTYEGFTTQNITQQTIPLDGSTVVVEIRYARNSHSLTWDVNGGGTLSGTYPRGDTKYGAAITKPDTPTYTGHTFGGWYTDAGLTTVLEDNATMPNAALTLYAKWTQNTYTVAFDSNQGSGSSTPTTAGNLERTHGQAYSALPTVSRTGYAFNGWFKAASGGTAVQDTALVEAGHTLYAQWTANTYTVAFNSNEGSGTMANQGFAYDAAQNLTANTFTRTGYTFSGWNTAANGTGTSHAGAAAVNNLTDAAGGTVTLYAQWTPNGYAVSFHSNGGSEAGNISVTYGNAYGTLPTVTRPGYTFNGWYTAESGGTQVTSETIVMSNENHTLYAQWTANTYTVAFDSNGGSGSTMDSQNFTYDAVQILSSNTFTKTGYTFSGWKTTASGEGTLYANEGQVSNLTNVMNGTVTLYAQWTANTYTVVFHGNDSTSGTMDSQAFTYDSALQPLSLNEFIKEGYNFHGWNTVEDGVDGMNFADNTPVNNLTATANGIVNLYAQWVVDLSIARIGNAKYDTLEAAIDAVQEGETITLVRDHTPTKGIEIKGKDFSFTIDLNGKTLSARTESGVLFSLLECTLGNNELTIKDSLGTGKITGESEYGATIAMYSGTLILDGVTVECTSTSAATGTYLPVINVIHTANLHIKNGSIIHHVGKGVVISVGTGSTGTINISNSQLIAEANTAIEWEDGAEVIIGAGSSVIKGQSMAMGKAPTIADGVTLEASVNFDGSGKVEYNPANITTYKYLEVEE